MDVSAHACGTAKISKMADGGASRSGQRDRGSQAAEAHLASMQTCWLLACINSWPRTVRSCCCGVRLTGSPRPFVNHGTPTTCKPRRCSRFIHLRGRRSGLIFHQGHIYPDALRCLFEPVLLHPSYQGARWRTLTPHNRPSFIWLPGPRRGWFRHGGWWIRNIHFPNGQRLHCHPAILALSPFYAGARRLSHLVYHPTLQHYLCIYSALPASRRQSGVHRSA
ncbi:hypothetical protein B0I35DRAFT_250792 [Stachybotrys elegans]|uniref:Uncharacterized protein n=1 Tax=Stachybotrys elegans TaxID=80388 RepID=A0A8K0WRF9_9HYPO|nr:hypothetical protein B0I35DRAFT_250792 [Stachybotrys elegans]